VEITPHQHIEQLQTVRQRDAQSSHVKFVDFCNDCGLEVRWGEIFERLIDNP